ncbi:MAG: hypothetical protein EOP54_27945 [Sphingobacteriales bacterium]|nr:MAG: hypothetical protein EOP54_27945 [Sphingobacteriales bacterium]
MEFTKMKLVNTKIGDVFCVKIDDSTKKYFQLIAYDLTQLNSDVTDERAGEPDFRADDLSCWAWRS